MPGAATVTSLQQLYKVEFQNGLGWRSLMNSKFWLLVKKSTNHSARHKERTVSVTAGPQGSATFEDALATRGPGTSVTFLLQKKPYYLVGSISNEVMTSHDSDQIFNAVKDELRRKGDLFGKGVQRKLWGDAGGSLGRLAASGGVSGSTLVLRTFAQARAVKPGDVLQLASDNGTGTSPAGVRAGYVTVSSVAVATKTITCTAAITTGIPAASNSDYVFVKGDYGLSFSGIPGWCPDTAPSSSESFHGIDRTAYGDTPKLSGWRCSTIYPNKTKNVTRGLAEASFYDIAPDKLFCNPMDYDAWKDEFAKPEYRELKTKYDLGVKAMTISTPVGDVDIIPEPMCPENYWIATRMNLWEFISQGEVPQKPRGDQFKLEPTADAWQFRLIGYMFVDNEDPGASVIGNWS